MHVNLLLHQLGLSGGAITGIVIGSVIGFILVLVVIVFAVIGIVALCKYYCDKNKRLEVELAKL